jgi:two-component system, OmpR family, alkaline phosphatase synthesis response regulator PhoP
VKRILVIEDEKSVLNNILEILESGGFKPTGAKTGTQGIRLAKEQVPHLILCDIMMPELDGYGVFTALKQESLTATIPFIFITAKSEHTDVRHGMNLGIDDYITKPFRRMELLDAIAIRLNRQTVITQQYNSERQRVEDLQQRVQELEQLNATNSSLLRQLIEDLRQPLSSINMIMHLLKDSPSPAQRDFYLATLRSEFTNQIALINQVSELQNLLTPDNLRLLKQLNLLNPKEGKKRLQTE